MKDFLDQELNIGDYVIGIDHGQTSSQFFARGNQSFFPKMAEVKFDSNKKKRFVNWGSCLISPYKLIKIER